MIAVPKRKLEQYRRISRAAGKVWRQYGALEYRECVGDDLNVKFGLPFPKLARVKSIRPLVARFGRAHGEAIVGNHTTAPGEVVSFLRSLPPTSEPLAGVGADSVLDAELVAKYWA